MKSDIYTRETDGVKFCLVQLMFYELKMLISHVFLRVFYRLLVFFFCVVQDTMIVLIINFSHSSNIETCYTDYMDIINFDFVN